MTPAVRDDIDTDEVVAGTTVVWRRVSSEAAKLRAANNCRAHFSAFFVVNRLPSGPLLLTRKSNNPSKEPRHETEAVRPMFNHSHSVLRRL